MVRHVIAPLVCVLCWLASAPTDAHAQGAPPVDQSEGGGAAGTQLRLGPAVLSGSAWIDGVALLGASDQEEVGGFRVRRGRVGIAGSLSPRLGYSLSGELTAQPALRNAFVVFRLSDQVSLRLGQANPLTALERGTSPMSMELIDRSGATNALTGPSDIGITIMSTTPYRNWLGYAVNVTNGSGFNRQDDNNSKDVSARIALTPLSDSHLLVVASGTRGRQPTGLRTRTSLGLDYKRGSWHVLADWLRQRRSSLPLSDGYVAMVAYAHRPVTARPNFAGLDVAARVWVLNDRATAAGVPADVVNDDGGGDTLVDPNIVTTREFQAGVSYYLTANVRLMGNIVVPFDERADVGPRALMRWQFQF